MSIHTPSLDKEKRFLDRKLEALREKDHVPAPLLDLLSAIYDRQIEARQNAQVVLPPDDTLADQGRRSQGAPLLEREDFPCDHAQARDLFLELLALLKEQEEPLAGAAAVVEQAVRDNDLDVEEAIAKYLEGDQEFFGAWAQKTPQAPSTVHFLIQASVTPSVSAAADALYRRVYVRKDEEGEEQDATWGHGHCPVCGSAPYIARLLGKQGLRYLSCSFCQTEYRVKRLMCPYCGEEDPNKMAYFDAEEEPGFRVELCKSCNMYIKTVDFHDFDRTSLPLLDDLESLTLDVLADREGYKRPTASGWGF
jgi:FdhE protein